MGLDDILRQSSPSYKRQSTSCLLKSMLSLVIDLITSINGPVSVSCANHRFMIYGTI